MSNNESDELSKHITSDDLANLRIFIKTHKDDKESPIVWIAEIVEKLARQSRNK